MQDYFKQLEGKLLSEEVRKSRSKLDFLLDEEFIEFGSSGKIYNKEIILDRLPDSEFSPIEITDFSISEISEYFVQTRFQTIEENRTSLRSSIWKKYDGNDWKMIFHQGTQVTD